MHMIFYPKSAWKNIAFNISDIEHRVGKTLNRVRYSEIDIAAETCQGLSSYPTNVDSIIIRIYMATAFLACISVKHICHASTSTIKKTFEFTASILGVSVESRFRMFRSDRRTGIYRRQHEDHRNPCIIQADRFGGPGVISGGIAYYLRTNLLYIDVNLNAARYKDDIPTPEVIQF